MAHHTGIGRYIRGLLSTPSLTETLHHWHCTLIGNNEAQKSFSKSFSFRHTNAKIYGLAEQIAIPLAARGLDCLHVPHYNAPLFWNRKLVITVHDLIHLRFPECLPLQAKWYAQTMLKLVTRRADEIISVSESTKKDLVETLGVRPEKITVIHHGIEPKFLAQSHINRSEVEPDNPYFLCVGLLKAHKNIGVLLKAFLKIKKRSAFPNLRLYLIGHPDTRQEIVRQWLNTTKSSSSIFLLENIGDEELMTLYQNAVALVFPSLCEGFGFPLLEAMASRIPIIASRIDSTLEIAGEGGGIYFDPNSADELENRMEQILTHPELRQQIVKENVKRLFRFDWKQTIEKTVQVYESAAGSD